MKTFVALKKKTKAPKEKENQVRYNFSNNKTLHNFAQIRKWKICQLELNFLHQDLCYG